MDFVDGFDVNYIGSLDLMPRRLDATPGPKWNPRKGNPRTKTRSNSVVYQFLESVEIKSIRAHSALPAFACVELALC